MPQSIRASLHSSAARHRPPASPPGSTNSRLAPTSAATPSGMRSLRSRAQALSGPPATAAIPGRIHRATVIANAAAVDHCPTVQRPSRSRSAVTNARTPSSRRTPAGNIQPSSTTLTAVSTAATGTPIRHQPGNEISIPSCLRMKPRPIRFVGVPIGVASPPTDAAKATQSSNPVAKPGAGTRPAFRPASSIATIMPDTIASIIAVTQVLERTALAVAHTAATAASTRPGRSATPGSASTVKASRLSRPWSRIASARRNEPISRKINGSANGANTTWAGATPATTQATAPTSAVTARGRASVIHRTTTATTIAASACAWGERSMATD